jgi:hypothetical protein
VKSKAEGNMNDDQRAKVPAPKKPNLRPAKPEEKVIKEGKNPPPQGERPLPTPYPWGTKAKPA